MSRTADHYRLKRIFIRDIKAKVGCEDCPENDPICLDFHHRDSQTKHERLKRNGGHKSLVQLPWEVMMKELELCDVLCSNCHRKREYRGEVD